MDKQILSKISSYLKLIRPFTLLAPIIVSIFIMLASFFYSDNIESLSVLFFTTILPASIALSILNGASNTLNQITDLKSDKISKPYRPLPKKLISIKEAWVVCIIFYIISLSISFMINTMFFILVLAITFFTVSYSLPPRFKDKIFINQLWVGIPRGLLAILASWSVFSNPFQALPITIGLLAMVFLIGGSITKDITDKDADKKTGTKTLVNTYGIKRAAILAFPFMFFPFAFIPILVNGQIIEPAFFLLTFLIIPATYIFYLMVKDSKTKHLENTKSWAMMYTTYFIFAFSFSIITIAGKTMI